MERYSSWMLERIGIGDTTRLRIGVSTIGRHSSSNIRILEALCVSRNHAIIEVSKDDEIVTLQDVSSNGVYVNEQRFEKTTTQLKNNDLIGIGVPPTDCANDSDILKLPIYQLKYAPIRKLHAQRTKGFPLEPASKPGLNSETDRTIKNDINKEAERNADKDGQSPCCSTINKANKLNIDEVFEISDDDECDVVEKAKVSPFVDEKHYINSSQENQDSKSKYTVLNMQKAAEFIGQHLSQSGEDINQLNHIPIISDIKKEILRTVSDDIQSIFGDIKDDDEIQKTIKEINPLVYNEMRISNNLTSLNAHVNILTNGAVIVLSDDEDLEGVKVAKLGTVTSNITETNNKNSTIVEDTKRKAELKELANNVEDAKKDKEKNNDAMGRPKSPNIFDSSFDKSKEDDSPVKGKQNNEAEKSLENVDNINLVAYTEYLLNNDEDIEDIMFSQAFINDMKAELQSDLNDRENLSLNNSSVDNQLQPATSGETTVIVKKEPGLEIFPSTSEELDKTLWVLSDDEDYDKELETKVKDWSDKIFSQSYNMFSQNLSQVYELDEAGESGSSEEDDILDENDAWLLEDDLESIANIYNSMEEINVDENQRSINDEKTNDVDQTDKSIPRTKRAPDSNDLQEKLKSNETTKIDKEEINHKQEHYTEQKTPDVNISKCSNDEKYPTICLKRFSKKDIAINSSHSPVEELSKRSKISDGLIPEADRSTAKILPPIIDAPSLPKHRGKLRGVSAKLPKKTTQNEVITSINKTLNSVKQKIHQESYFKDLKTKWLEKPSIAKKRDKERKKLIKECRKARLQELTERKKSPSRETIKRKLSTEGRDHIAKNPKVKVTHHNRGAFLTSNESSVLSLPSACAQKPEMAELKMPSTSKKSGEPNISNNKEKSKNETPNCSRSVDCFETFSQQLSKPDILLLKHQNPDNNKSNKPNKFSKVNKAPPLRNHSTPEAATHLTPLNLESKNNLLPSSNVICKEAIAARAVRTTNKITFASMEKNIAENEECKRKLIALDECKKPSIQKKRVRFNDTPVIYYIERITGAHKKICNKDVMPLTRYKDRRHMIKTAYPIIDYTDAIISDILCWSNEWLIKRNAAATTATDLIYPMSTHFDSYKHYKSVIFPIMKLEFLSTLEREYNMTHNVKHFKVSLEYAIEDKNRIMLITKFSHSQNKELTESSAYDLVILEPNKKGPQIFAFVVANRKETGTNIKIIYGIAAKNITVNYFNAIREFNVRPVMDKVRVHFGAFNSVHQLQSTPLFQKILNPLELLKCRQSKKNVNYRGYDKLNDKQKEVLLNTYIKIIDESTPNITLIQGPPGTGKSRVITNLILQTLYGEEVRYLDKKILICAQSNAAVDVIAAKLYNISMKMRPAKRFRLIRYGVLHKIHPNVLPIALQKLVECENLKRLQAKNDKCHFENNENLKIQILQVEAEVAEMSARNIKGTVEEDKLIEKKRQLQLMRNILNGSMRPEDEHHLFSWYLYNANIVCATLSSCVNLSQYIDYFDICIIDEATQCTEPWTLFPLKFGINSLVLVGDTQQLPATVLSKKANELGLGTSMFTRIQQCLDSVSYTSAKDTKGFLSTPKNVIYSLQTQYRMHPEICLWPNQYFYRNELLNDISTLESNKSPLVPFSILSLTYTQNSACVNGKITNNLEAEFVAKLLKALDGFIPNKYNSYGVITPYAHHCATLESSIRMLGLTNIMVNTIDSYQGLEKDVIVISNARTNGIGFLSNAQRLNVALTRSKKCLILCGNFKNLETVPAWRCLLENARNRNLYHEISSNSLEDIQRNVIDKIKLKS